MERIKYFSPPPIEYHKIEPFLREIIISRNYTKGRFRDMLEDELENYLQVNNVVVTSSGTSSLWIAMRVLRNLTNNEYISLPTFTWSSVKESAVMAGYKIKWIDIERDTWLPVNTEDNKNDILGHDTFGSLDINSYPERNCIIDATHSVGIDDRWAWDRGMACVGSMAATKPMTAGEGGIIATNNQYFARKCGELRDMCARIPEMSCVLALESLAHLDENSETKKKIASYYRKNLSMYQFQLYKKSTHSKVCFLCDNSDELIARAAASGVELRKYYRPLSWECRNANDVFSKIVCLPAWTDVNTKQVVKALRRD